MATLSVSNITSNVTTDNGQPGNFFGQPVEFFRVASGGASADTVAITPRFIRNIKTVMSELGTTNALVASNSASSVTLTLSTGTVTAAGFDVWIFGQRDPG